MEEFCYFIGLFIFRKKCTCTPKLQQKKTKPIISLYRSTGLDLKFGEHNMNYSQWLFERENSHHSDDFKELTGSKKITHRPFVLPALGRKEGKRHRCLFKTVNQAKLQSDTTALM